MSTQRGHLREFAMRAGRAWHGLLLLALAVVGYVLDASAAIGFLRYAPPIVYLLLGTLGFVWVLWRVTETLMRDRDRLVAGIADEAQISRKESEASIADLKAREIALIRENRVLRKLRQDEFILDILDRRFGRKSRWVLAARMKRQRQYFEELKDEIGRGEYGRASELFALRQIMDLDLLEYTGGGIGGDEKQLDEDLDGILQDLIRKKLVVSPEEIGILAREVEET